MKRTIILLSPYSQPVTGAHVRFDRLARSLAADGGAIFWLSPRRDDISLPSNVRFLRTPDMAGRRLVSIWMSLGLFFNVFRLLRLRGSSPLVVSFGETNLIPSALAAFLSNASLSVGIRSNIKKCSALNSDANDRTRAGIHALLMRFAFAIWGKIYRRADQVVVQTMQAKHSAIDNFGISSEKIEILGNDIPEERTAGHYARRRRQVPQRVIFVGNDSRVKGFDVLIAALSEFNGKASTIEELTVVGVSAAACQRAELAARGAGIFVKCLGPRSDVISVMEKNDLLIVPSREDQFPNVILEALAIGLPVIGSDVDGITHILQDRRILFEPGNAASLLRTLTWVCTEDGYASVRELVERRADIFRFDWEGRYIRLLSNLR